MTITDGDCSRYITAQSILDRFKRDEDALRTRALASHADGWGTGQNDGPHGSDVNDPTGGAVIARTTTSEAATALNQLDTAIALLLTADRTRKLALPPDPDATEPDMWCTSCLRIKWHTPRDTTRKWSQPNTTCTWCSSWRREHGWLPPEWILTKRARGERITTADVATAITENRRRGKKRR